jgi:16S rRNA (guanine966-N2)-methyltransferase
LGIEALSRGAKKVVFVDHRQSIVSEIQNQITRLELHDSSVILSDSLSYLDNPSHVQPFDIIFLDPPFGTYNLEKLLSHIFETEWLDSHGMVYYESNHSLESNLINSSWDKYRESKAGNVYYGLLTKKISN